MIASACSVRPTASAVRMASPDASSVAAAAKALRASARAPVLALRQSSASASASMSRTLAASPRAVARGSVVVKVRVSASYYRILSV